MPVRDRIFKSLTFVSIATSVVLGNWLHPYLEGQAVDDPFAVRLAIAILSLAFFAYSLLQKAGVFSLHTCRSRLRVPLLQV